MKKKRKKSDISPRSRYFPTIRDRRGIAGISVSGTRSHVGFLTRRGRQKRKKESKKKKKKKERNPVELRSRCLLTREPRRFSGLLVIEIQPTLVPNPLPFSLTFFFFLSFFSFATYTESPTNLPPFPPIYQHLKSIFLLFLTSPRFVYETESRRGHEALEIQHKDAITRAEGSIPTTTLSSSKILLDLLYS